MRGGQVVTYCDPGGALHAGAVCGIPDTGPSGAKILDLRLADGTVVSGVPHEGDRQDGAAFWRLGAPPAPPESTDAPARPFRRRN